MKAIIQLDVPDWQIGQNVTVHFPDTMMKHAKCELLKEQKTVEPKQVDLHDKDEWWGFVCVCPDCKAEWMSDKDDVHFCPKCGQAVKWE